MTDITIQIKEEILQDKSTVFDVIVAGSFFEGTNAFPASTKRDANKLATGLYSLINRHSGLIAETVD